MTARDTRHVPRTTFCRVIAALAALALPVGCGGTARPAFDPNLAHAAIGATSLAACSTGAPLEGHVTLVFTPEGGVDTAVVDGGDLVGKPVAACVERVFRGVKIAPFSGGNATARHSFHMK